MKFSDFTVSGFGVWSGLALRDLSPQLTVLWGPNEAGKTTILECLRGVLYGFSPVRRDRYLPPVHGGMGGGTLRIQIQHESHEVVRVDDRSRLLGGVTVTGPDGSTQGEPQLKELLSAVDESIYSNVFAVGLRELQELATLNDTEAAGLLYDLSTGLDRVSISEVVRELRASRTRLISTDGAKSLVLDLVAQSAALQTEIKELGELNTRYWNLASERESAAHAIRELETEVSQLAAGLDVVETAVAIRDAWKERAEVEQQLNAYGKFGDFPPDAARRLDGIKARLDQARRRRAQIKRRGRKLRAERQAITVNEPLWRQAPRIAALAEHETWIAMLDEQFRAAEQQVAEGESQLSAARAKCGLPEEVGALGGSLSQRALNTLRGPASQLRDARKRLKAQQEECSAMRDRQGTCQNELQQALSSRGQQDLAAALESQGELVATYRRRLLLDDRLEQMALHRQELEDQHQRLNDQQEMPLWLLLTVAAIFVLGGGMVLAGLIIPLGTAVTIVGGLIALGAAAGKIGFDRSTTRRLAATKKQLQMLERQYDLAKAERAEIDQQLPRGGGSLTSRLQAAEAELAALEDVLSIDAKRQAADDEAAQARKRLKAAGDEWNQTRRRWQQALAAIGLPTNLLPAHVKQMAAQSGELSTLERQLSQSRQQFDRCGRERASVAARIDQLWTEAGWDSNATTVGTPPPPALVERLRRLRREVVIQEELAERRDNLDEQLKRLRRFASKYRRRARRLAALRRGLFRAAGAADEADFRRRAGEQDRWQELLRRRDGLSQHIQSALRGRNEHEVSEMVIRPPEQLNARRAEIVAHQQAVTEQIKRLAEQCGKIDHEQSQLSDDRRLGQRQIDLDIIEERLADAAARWRTLALTEHLLDSVKQEYERNRQPEVLQEASLYLARMTGGRYHRVWTPLGERTLRVDDEENRSLPIELLSSGAREQVFLSLRLALVSRYARQGTPMPMVLDDVLVNFDAERAEAAAAAFAEFARSGHQLIMFTCHEHIARLFQTLHVDVRRLPGNSDGSTKIVGPERIQHDPPAEPPRRRREKRGKDAVPDASVALPEFVPLDMPAIQPAPSNVEAEPVIETPDESIDRPTPPPAPSQTKERKRRADSPHGVAPSKAVRRRRWSAEEFEGELEDQVNTAFEEAAWSGTGSDRPARNASPSSNGDQ